MTAFTPANGSRQAGMGRAEDRARPIRLLMVEDDERIRMALGLALADEGCVVVEAASGEAALAVVDHAAIDVVLLDLMLPGIDGLEVCRTVRSRGDMPIIIVSARSDSSDVVAGLEAGADDYVTKPLVAGELAARIRALLRRRRPGNEGPASAARAPRDPSGGGDGHPRRRATAPDPNRVRTPDRARGGAGPGRDTGGSAAPGVGL